MKNSPLIAITLLLLLGGCVEQDEEPIRLPSLVTLALSEISVNSAKSGGNVTNDGGGSISAKGLVWSTSPMPTVEEHAGITSEGAGVGLFSGTVGGLVNGTRYYLRAYASNQAGTAYGNELEFSTIDKANLSTANIADITTTSAKSGGNIISDGGSPIASRGVCWATSANPTIDGSKTADGSGVGSFASTLTELNPGVTYYVRAYAVNDAGVSYGPEQIFKTQSAPTAPANPVPANNATGQPTSLTLQWAVSTDPDGDPVTYDVYFGTSTSPVLVSEAQTDNSLSRTDLSHDQIYYWKVVARDNKDNITAGPMWHFTTGVQQGESGLIFNPDLNYGTLTDIEGNSYKVIQIGSQVWMAENLRTTKYNDGTAIPLVTDNSSWSYRTRPAYCWYDNDKNKNAAAYGALYNWFTVETEMLCPTGWHVPTDVEWSQLATNLGSEHIAGSQMKETGYDHWNIPNTGAINVSGFTGVPGGIRRADEGTFQHLGYHGSWWTSTAYSGREDAWHRYLDFDNEALGLACNRHKFGYSVRCLRD
jgi:uncharacterized protein (TIGR02145 family)